MLRSEHTHGSKLSRKSGLAPGTLLHIGERRVDTPRITVVEYNETQVITREFKHTEDCGRVLPDSTLWLNVDGIHEIATIEDIGRIFHLHPLLLEDVMNASQRPKIEEYDDCLFVVVKMLDLEKDHETIVVEHLSLIVGRTFVITFQEREGDVFEAVRGRIQQGLGRVRKMGADYLAYRLLDAIVDHYFVVLDEMGEWIDELEHDAADDSANVDVHLLHVLKREALYLKKMIWPAREIMASLARAEAGSVLSEQTHVYFRDVHDHVLQATDMVENQREVLQSMLETYHSALSNKMNEVMKVLAIISTIFIPLSFIAGVYGMNFAHMPELQQPWGYPAVLLLMAVTFVGFVAYFKRKGWF